VVLHYISEQTRAQRLDGIDDHLVGDLAGRGVGVVRRPDR
jgi:hypothetical protein